MCCAHAMSDREGGGAITKKDGCSQGLDVMKTIAGKCFNSVQATVSLAFDQRRSHDRRNLRSFPERGVLPNKHQRDCPQTITASNIEISNWPYPIAQNSQYDHHREHDHHNTPCAIPHLLHMPHLPPTPHLHTSHSHPHHQTHPRHHTLTQSTLRT